MTSWLVIFWAFFSFFSVPPTLNLRKNPVNQLIKKSSLYAQNFLVVKSSIYKIVKTWLHSFNFHSIMEWFFICYNSLFRNLVGYRYDRSSPSQLISWQCIVTLLLGSWNITPLFVDPENKPKSLTYNYTAAGSRYYMKPVRIGHVHIALVSCFIDFLEF